MGTITSWMISFPYIICGIWNGYFANIARQIFFANDIQMAYDHALLWISMNDGCAMRKCGSRDFQWLRDGARQNVCCICVWECATICGCMFLS